VYPGLKAKNAAHDVVSDKAGQEVGLLEVFCNNNNQQCVAE
jgi:hypothetical protein